MELKRVLAEDMRTAKEQAWTLFGKDVLILSSERVNGRVELIVASDDQARAPVTHAKPEEPALLPRSDGEKTPFSAELIRAADLMRASRGDVKTDDETSPASRRPVSPSTDDESSRAQELVDVIRKELQQMRNELQNAKALFSSNYRKSPTSEIESFIRAMEEADIPFALRLLLAEEAQGYEDLDQAHDRIRLIMQQNMQAAAATTPAAGFHVIAGPTGAGKSHMVSRLAGMQGASLSAEDVAIISYNDQKPGAWPQIQLIGSNAGADVYRAKNASVLVELLAHLTDRKLVIIDTPGKKCLEQVEQIRSHVATANFHLAIPADAPAALCRRLIDDSGVSWQSLMVTKADECLSAWPLLSHLSQKQSNISFVGDIAMNQDSSLLGRATSILIEKSLRQLIAMSESSMATGSSKAGEPASSLPRQI